MNNEIYNEAIRIINERKIKAERDAEERKNQLEEKIPGFREINENLSSTICELAKVVILKSPDAESQIEKIKQKNLESQKLKNDLIVSNGYPSDYLDTHYTCDICGDTGIFKGRRCRCFNEIVEKIKIEKFNENSSVKMCDFDDFSLFYYDGKDAEIMTRIFGYCKKYALNFSKNSESLFMCGETGLGKTHLSLSIAKEVIAKGYNVAYDSIINYLNEIDKERYGKSDKNTLETITSVDLLILDDLGAEVKNPFYHSTIYNIINTRINRNLPTIINSNLTNDDISERYDDRVASRIFGEYTYLRFAGNDIRQIKKLKKS